VRDLYEGSMATSGIVAESLDGDIFQLAEGRGPGDAK
jgi:hypothetical protein